MRKIVVALVIALFCAPSAHAAFPGQNGKIAWSSIRCDTTGTGSCEDPEIHSANADGTGGTQLTTNNAEDVSVAWSPDGTTIAFASNRDGNYEIYVMAPDGSGQTRLTTNAADDGGPAWSPDGTKIAFHSNRDGNDEIYVMNADGSGQTRITTDPAFEASPAWAPDGTKIAFYRNPSSTATLNLMNPDGSGKSFFKNGYSAEWLPSADRLAFNRDGPGSATCNFTGITDVLTAQRDGTGETNLTNNQCVSQDVSPAWAPDGTRYAVRKSCTSTSTSDGCQPGEIYTVSATGGSPFVNVSHNDTSTEVGYDYDPDWQPIPINSYPRPRGATPLQIYLVPAYEQCLSPTRTHGPPLSFPSCNPPTQESGALTVGTADSNGRPTKSVASIRFDTIIGQPGPPADEADVQITAAISDVYAQAGLADYTGNVHATVPLRITDKLNTPHPGGSGAGTVSDTSLDFPIPCAATADTTVGATCALNSTVDAVIPGAVTESRRSIWALGQVQVNDAGGAPFLRQGIFIP